MVSIATGSSPSLLDMTISYDYSTDVDAIDSNAPCPTIQQLAQLFTVKVNQRETEREEGGEGGKEREGEGGKERERERGTERERERERGKERERDRKRGRDTCVHLAQTLISTSLSNIPPPPTFSILPPSHQLPPLHSIPLFLSV